MHHKRKKPRRTRTDTWTSPVDKSPLPDREAGSLKKRQPKDEPAKPFEVWTRYTGQHWTPKHRGKWLRQGRYRTKEQAEEWIRQQQRKWLVPYKRQWPYDFEIRESKT